MKTLKIFVLVLIFALIVLPSEAQVFFKVKIDSVPTTVEGFKKMRDQLAKKPEGGAAMFLLALKVYTENQELGKKFLVLTIVKKHLVPGDYYKGYALGPTDTYLLNQLMKKPYIINSYIKGATPENGYKAELPYIYKFQYQRSSGNPLVDKSVKIFVKCYGADRTRPITLDKNSKGIWKVAEFSSIVVSVRPPADQNEDDDDL